jgi:hypothetical protein
MKTSGIYIYGIVPNIYEPELFRLLKNYGVYFITHQNISAIVSDRDSAYFDFSDREFLAHQLVHHQKTIEQIMAIGFSIILPMKLGTIVQSKEEVLTILSKGYDLIMATLKKIEFQIEIDLAVTWADFDNTLKETATHPDIIEMKESLLKNIGALSQIDQMKIGMLIQETLDKKNKQVELNILEALSSISIDIKMHEVMNDQMITNSAFIINRNKQEKFEQAIDQLDEEYKGTLNFKIVGPLPCYSFYTIEVKELNPEQVVLAKKELGLREETSESEIKKAYLEKAKLFHPDTYSNDDNDDNFNKINRAYHTMRDYSAIARQSSKDDLISLARENMSENLILVKIRE